jgi:hypothetical protein
MSQISPITIAELNDHFRQNNLGFGKVIMTPMVSMMPLKQQASLLKMVKSFNDFNEGNGKHDFGIVEFQDEQYSWKLDYYDDASYEYSSKDPCSPLTRRTMTIMHSSE